MNQTEHSQNSEICRVCRSEGTADQPLFYPCLCSGSIKYIHQDCLIEWLKHSKKRYCELCKHPFTFSPVYAQQMPQKIPINVLVLGLVKKVIRGTRISLSLSFASILWFLAVPIITSQIFRYYFGWSLQGLLQSAFALSIEDVDDFVLETSLTVLFDAIQGFLLTGFTVFLVLGMMLVREFISMIRHTQPATPPTTTTAARNNRREREENEIVPTPSTEPETASVASTTLRSPLSPSSPTASPLSPIRRHSEFIRTTPLSPSGTSTSGNFWLDQVHPKEYRNYLRRRELHRELIEAEQIRSFNSAQENELLFMDSNENEPLLLSEDQVSNISGTTTLRSRFTNATSNSRPAGAESFRCRICASNTCINREHVVQSSQIRNSLAAQRHQSLLQRTNEAAASERSDTTADTNDIPTTPVNPTDTAADNQGGFGWNLDAAESLSFPEFFGFTLEGTPVLELLQNASIVVGCNTLVMHLFLFVPFITGKAVRNGSVINGSVKVLETLLMLLLKAESIKALTNVFSSRFHDMLLILFPTSINRYIELFTIEKDSLVAFGLNVVLGYAVICSLFSVYLKFTRNLTDSFHRILVPIVSFFGTFIKLITLLFIEMAAFPLICGFMVDFACLPLFPNASIFSRLQTVKSLPITSLSVHWALGAFFMISFASFVTFLRSFLRPGLLFFLRNPVDPDNHPVKEMVERGFLDQIYRLGISVIFYSVLVSCSVGLTVKSLQIPFISSLVFPLNIKFNDPLIEIPIDLLIQLLLRSLLNSLFPSKLFKNAFKSVSKLVIRSMNLSSYFIGGGRYLNEESFPKGGNWVAVPDFDRIYQRERLKEIRKRTVTPVDIAKLKILVDRQGLPVIETTTATSNSSSSSRTPTDWTVVFRPNHFKSKCFLVAIFAVLCVQIFLLSILLAPLLCGRWLIAAFQAHFTQDPPKTVHEIYSWTVGAVVCLLGCKALEFILYPAKKQQHRNDPESSNEEETMNFVSKLVYITKFVANSCLITLFAGIIWPLQVGLLFTLLVNPLISSTTLFNIPATNTLPVIFLGACWSLGIPLLRVLYSLRSHLPLPASTITYISDSTRFDQLNAKEFFKLAALPITLMLSLTLLLPPLSCLIAVPLLSPNPSLSTVLEFQNSSHLLALLAFLILKLVKAAVTFYQRVISGIRDETYLIGRRLHNLESRNTDNRNDIVSPLM